LKTQDALEYGPVLGWEHAPEGVVHRDVSDAAIDSDDNVYLSTRLDPRVLVYDRDGNFLRSWGEGLFSPRPHGITIGPDGYVWVVDERDQTIGKYTPSGEQVMTLGESGVRSETGVDWQNPSFVERQAMIRGGPPFNHPTAIAIGPNGDLYVSDGYGNARVHRFSADGVLKASYGSGGTGPGQFRLPHALVVDSLDRLLVCDRESDRIQVLSLDGEFVTEWTNVQRPSGVAVDDDGCVYVAESPWPAGSFSFRTGSVDRAKPGRVSILSPAGEPLARIGGGDDGCAPANFRATHGIAVDSRKSIYVTEAVYTASKGEAPADCHTVQKLERVD
jgi:hypothetical protein